MSTCFSADVSRLVRMATPFDADRDAELASIHRRAASLNIDAHQSAHMVFNFSSVERVTYEGCTHPYSSNARHAERDKIRAKIRVVHDAVNALKALKVAAFDKHFASH